MTPGYHRGKLNNRVPLHHIHLLQEQFILSRLKHSTELHVLRVWANLILWRGSDPCRAGTDMCGGMWRKVWWGVGDVGKWKCQITFRSNLLAFKSICGGMCATIRHSPQMPGKVYHSSSSKAMAAYVLCNFPDYSCRGWLFLWLPIAHAPIFSVSLPLSHQHLHKHASHNPLHQRG